MNLNFVEWLEVSRENKKEGKPLLESSADFILEPVKVFRFLGSITLVVLVLSICSKLFIGINLVYRFGGMFYVDKEYNIPTGFSVFLLQFAAFLLLMISALKYRKPFSVYWIILTIGFAYMSIDESWSIHEVIDSSNTFLNAKNYHGFLHFSWIIPFLILIPVLLLFFLRFLNSLPRKTRKYFLISGVIYVGGAVAVESLGGYLVDTIGRDNWWYYAEVTLEEGMEMFGVTLFIYALLDYLKQNYRELKLRFGKK